MFLSEKKIDWLRERKYAYYRLKNCKRVLNVNNATNNIRKSLKRIPKKHLFFYSAIIALLAIFLFLYIHSKSRTPSKNSARVVHSDIKVIAWDLHDVLFYGKPGMLQVLWEYKRKHKLIPGSKVTKLILKDVKRIIMGKESRLNATRVIQTALRYGQNELAEFIIAHEADCTPKNDMIEIVKKLNALGYTQYICSNISSYGLQRLKEKYPEFFNYFEGTYTALEHNGSKPQERFFRVFLNTYKLKAGTVLFIDDKEENCRSAQRIGMQVMYFKGKRKGERKQSTNTIFHILGMGNNQISAPVSPVQQGIS